MLVVNGVLWETAGVAALNSRRDDLTPETQYPEEEEPKSGWAFAQLRRLGLGLMTVSDKNPA